MRKKEKLLPQTGHSTKELRLFVSAMPFERRCPDSFLVPLWFRLEGTDSKELLRPLLAPISTSRAFRRSAILSTPGLWSSHSRAREP
eukprot:scaffold1659_cov371-Prasinococcus_capsulatus_cf.AAC.3